MIIKVSGATGFIGKAVLRNCHSSSIPVIGYTRNKNCASSDLIAIKDYGEIPDEGILIHLAEEKVASNMSSEIIEAQLKIANNLSNKKFQSIVYASSAVVYSNSEDLINIDSQYFADSLYSQSKRKCEEYFLKKNHKVARVANVYGPEMSVENLFSTIIKQKDNEIISVQTLNAVRDFIWIEDVARQLVQIALAKSSGIYHVSTGVGSSIEQIIKIICDISGNNNYIIKELKMDVPFSRIVLNPSKTIEKIQSNEFISLREGLIKLLGEI